MMFLLVGWTDDDENEVSSDLILDSSHLHRILSHRLSRGVRITCISFTKHKTSAKILITYKILYCERKLEDLTRIAGIFSLDSNFLAHCIRALYLQWINDEG